MTKNTAIAAAFCVSVTAQPAFASVTITSASVEGYSYSQIGDSRYNINRVQDHIIPVAMPLPISVSASSVAETTMNTGAPFNTYPYLFAKSSGVATLSAIYPTSFSFNVAGTQSTQLSPSPGQLSYAVNDYRGLLTINFLLDQTYKLDFSHSLLAVGQTISDFAVLDSSGVELIYRSRVGGALFTESFVLFAGSYRAYLSSGLINSVASSVGGQTDSSIDSTQMLTFAAPTIAAVPEPATWTLMVVAFGIAGAALRRHRAAVGIA